MTPTRVMTSTSVHVPRRTSKTSFSKFWNSPSGSFYALAAATACYATPRALRREHRTRELFRLSSGQVLSGPFQGMILPDEESWGDGDRGSKILGCYEINLHQVLLIAVGRKPSVIVNVGCAEGYYAVGLARLLPEVTVHAFDIDKRAQIACKKGAERNGVASRTKVAGLCDVGKLQEILIPAGRKLDRHGLRRC